MSDQTCLKRHLLFASVQAYHPSVLGYSSGPPRWREAPAGIGGQGIDFALAGVSPKAIVIAFRGTLPPLDLAADCRTIIAPEFSRWPAVIRDWLNNLNTLPRPDAPAGDRPALPGRVHPGFAASLDRLWAGVTAAVDRLGGGEQGVHLYFTGHSKGGALANLAAVCARQRWPGSAVKVATFGAPHAGDARLRRGLSRARDRLPALRSRRRSGAGHPARRIGGRRGHAFATVTFPPPLAGCFSSAGP